MTEQSYDCHSACEVILKYIGKINIYLTTTSTTKHEYYASFLAYTLLQNIFNAFFETIWIDRKRTFDQNLAYRLNGFLLLWMEVLEYMKYTALNIFSYDAAVR